ncbi:hypothetical protein F5Y17DRAFT_431704 [Xylariaceae sp. FL0594]|nr:hypothetical protein F5Y17DRAFT_431704 [Xylariaceae sp. FL0594]
MYVQLYNERHVHCRSNPTWRSLFGWYLSGRTGTYLPSNLTYLALPYLPTFYLPTSRLPCLDSSLLLLLLLLLTTYIHLPYLP